MASSSSSVNGRIANGKMKDDDIYENLPCREKKQQPPSQQMRNGGTDEEGGSASGGGGVDDESVSGGFSTDQPVMQQHENNNKIQNNLAMDCKDSLYATPLKKSDRPKPQGATPKAPISGGDRRSTRAVDDNLNNSSDRDVKIINAELEDRRIRDFLKDTSQMHKKIELHKEYQSSNFSYLARKEHFVNLVQQNVLNDSLNGTTGEDVQEEEIDQSLLGYKSLANEEEDKNLDVDINESLDELEARCNEKLEMLTNLHRHRSAERSQEDNEQLDVDLPPVSLNPPLRQKPPTGNNHLVNGRGPSHASVSRNPKVYDPSLSSEINAYLNREWVLKKIAMCLEQRASKKPVPIPPGAEPGECVPSSTSGFFPRAASTHQQSNRGGDLPSLGYLVLGSNGSGKTSICNDIIEGTSGTKGMLNRRLLACYFVNSQNPECHSLSMFIRSMILQILSHSSFICLAAANPSANGTATANDLTAGEVEPKISSNEALPEADQKPPEGAARVETKDVVVEYDKELEEIILTEIKINERVAEFCSKKKVCRQQSEPVESLSRDKEASNYPYTTHPPLQKSLPAEQEAKKDQTMSPGRSKVSKIPVAIGSSIRSPTKSTVPKDLPKSEGDEDEIMEGGGEGIADLSDIKLDEEINEDITEIKEQEEEEPAKSDHPPKPSAPEETITVDGGNNIPPPLPKSKNCRQVIADGYYEMLLSNPDIFESITVDSIEKNPDDCFKKAILFPLLELCPPKNALLLLIDSIDENYIQDGNLISTLKGKQVTKSRNIAELLLKPVNSLVMFLFCFLAVQTINSHLGIRWM